MSNRTPADAAAPLPDDPLWYKDAIIYELHVKAFHDSDGNGIGDFRGLAEKLDYLQHLGVNTLWLLPFYPSPLRDDGYDISDYRAVHPDYGTLADFRNFIREAHRRGLRVITELVVNHTSDQHPWFQAARRAPAGSAKRNFYVWSDTDRKFPETRIIFTDTEKSNWAWDEVAGAYYWHRFFSHQPDLNHNNAEVVRAMTRVMRFWLDMGVDGMRLDAIPYLCVREGTNNENLPETHAVIRQMRSVIDAHYANRMFLAEANQWPEDVREYFGHGDECQMAYHFPLMPRMYMALAQEDRHPVVEIMRQTPDIPDTCQWAIFLRNHDELTLEMVTSSERDYMYRMYASDPRMRVNVGIRRRLAPLLDNDRARIELMSCLLMTMPGSPILYYGDEIGMGDNIFLGDRNGVRTPMQWSPDRNAGFSRADPQRLYLPPIMDPVYGYEAVNVESQLRSRSSLLNWTRRLIAVRKGFKAFGRGTLEFLEPGNRKILAYLRSYEDEVILCVANLSSSPQAVELDLSRWRERVPLELWGRTAFPPISDLPYMLTLPGYGFSFFRLATDMPAPHWHEDKAPRTELPVLVMLEGWRTLRGARHLGERIRALIASRTREQLQREVLAPYMQSKQWFAAHGYPIEKIELTEEAEWATAEGSWLMALLRVTPQGLEPQTYFLPMGMTWDDAGDEALHALGPWTLAKVRQKERMGILHGAYGDPVFCRALVRGIGENREVPFGAGRLRFSATTAYADCIAGAIDQEIRHPPLEQSNTAVLFGDKLFLKGYRLLHEGISPELEMGRFLTEASPYANSPTLAGAIEYLRDDGAMMTLAVLHRYVEHQGDAWHYVLDFLARHMDSVKADVPEGPVAGAGYGLCIGMLRTLGRRLGELHRALARRTGDPAFDPEPVGTADAERWARGLREEAGGALALLEQRLPQLPEDSAQLASQALGLRDLLMELVERGGRAALGTSKTRYHGDLHLGQALLTRDDFVITDFQGAASRPLEQRREKHCPLRDLAALLISIDYATRLALRQEIADRPGEREALEAASAAWTDEVTAAVAEGYLSVIDAGVSDAQQFEALLRFFIIEKALQQVCHELDGRPHWSDAPLARLVFLLRKAQQEEHQ